MALPNSYSVKLSHVKRFLLLTLIFLSGCSTTHRQYLSDHWVSQPQALHLVSANSRTSRLQVIIMYDGSLSSHSALRLESENGNVTFWDPAGAYGLVGHITDAHGIPIRPYGKRVKDIVITHIPDIPTYMRFRWLVGDSSVEIFEWDLPHEQTKELREVLRMGTEENHPKGEFHTETAPAFCSIAISNFLQRFVTPTLTLADTYLWPHNLAEALLDYSPSRVRVFVRGKPEMVFMAPRQQVISP